MNTTATWRAYAKARASFRDFSIKVRTAGELDRCSLVILRSGLEPLQRLCLDDLIRCGVIEERRPSPEAAPFWRLAA